MRERLSAGFAPVRLLSRVGSLVELQAVLQSVCAPARSALERPFARVYLFMIQQVGALSKRLLAKPASIRPLPRVDPHVTHQGAPFRKLPVTDLAPERFFPRVHSFMAVQLTLPCKCFVTD